MIQRRGYLGRPSLPSNSCGVGAAGNGAGSDSKVIEVGLERPRCNRGWEGTQACTVAADAHSDSSAARPGQHACRLLLSPLVCRTLTRRLCLPWAQTAIW
jgi:hypothetical protein